MKKYIIDKYVNILFIFRIPILLIVIFLFFYMGYVGQEMVYDSSAGIDNIVKENDPVLTGYNRFKEQFNSTESVTIALETENLYTNSFLKLITELAPLLQATDGVTDVLTLSTMNDIRNIDERLTIKPFIDKEDIPYTSTQLKRFEKRFSQHPFLKNKIVNTAGDAVVFYIRLNEKLLEDPKVEKALSNSIQNTVNKHIYQFNQEHNQKVASHFVGDIIVSSKISRVQQGEDYIATVMIIVLAIVLFFVFRSVLGSVLPVFISMTTISVVMGLKAVFYSPFSTIDSLLYALIFTISICDSVHFLSFWYSNEYKHIRDKKEKVKKILFHIIKPCFYTSITTAVGFAAIAITGITQLRHFGIFASFSVLLAFILTITFIPSALSLLELNSIVRLKEKLPFFGKHAKQANCLNVISQKLSSVTYNARYIIFAVYIGVFVISIFGIMNIKIGTDPYSFLKDSTDVNKSLRYIEREFCGIQDIELVLESDTKDFFKYPENLHALQNIQASVTGLEGINESNSIVYFVKLLNKALNNGNDAHYKIPETKRAVSQYLFLYEISNNPEELFDWVNKDYNQARINFKVKNNINLKNIRSRIDKIVAHTGMDISRTSTGSAVLWERADHVFLNNQIRSLLYSVALITLIIFLIVRNLKFGLISFIVNIFPIVVGFGVLGFSGIGLSMGTVLIAPIAIGIAVDDTIHVISHYTYNKEAGSVQNRLYQVFRMTLKPIVFTSVILAIGFGSNMISAFKPNCYFGLISAITLLVAMVSDLTLLPALIAVKDKRKEG